MVASTAWVSESATEAAPHKLPALVEGLPGGAVLPHGWQALHYNGISTDVKWVPKYDGGRRRSDYRNN